MVRSHLRRHLVGYLALFIALSGTSYAAVSLPKNSVGTKQIKNNAVTGAKVKNNSLSQNDLSAAARAALKGAIGPAGPTGSAGTPGAKGEKGDKGDPGTPGAPNPNAESVDGQSAARMFFRGNEGTGPTTILDLGGLQLVATCLGGSGGNVTVEADATGGGVISFVTGNGGGQWTNLAGSDDPLLMNDGGGFVSFVYHTAAGSIVGGELGHVGQAGAGTDCSLAGTAMHSPAP